MPLSTHFQNRPHFSGFCVRVYRTNRYDPFSIACLMCHEMSFSSCLNELNELETLNLHSQNFLHTETGKKRPSASLYNVLDIRCRDLFSQFIVYLEKRNKRKIFTIRTVMIINNTYNIYKATSCCKTKEEALFIYIFIIVNCIQILNTINSQ